MSLLGFRGVFPGRDHVVLGWVSSSGLVLIREPSTEMFLKRPVVSLLIPQESTRCVTVQFQREHCCPKLLPSSLGECHILINSW